MRFRDNVTKDLGFGRGLFFFWGARRSQCVPPHLVVVAFRLSCHLFFFRGSGGEVEWGFRAIM